MLIVFVCVLLLNVDFLKCLGFILMLFEIKSFFCVVKYCLFFVLDEVFSY